MKQISTPPKRRQARSRRGPESPARGAFRPHKSDVEAFASGKLNRKTRTIAAIIRQVFSENDKLRKAEGRFKAKTRQIHEKLDPSLSNITVTHPDGLQRAQFKQYDIVRGNHNAQRARHLIEEYADEMLNKRTVTEDERQMATFLKSMFIERGGALKPTPQIVEFRGMSFNDPRLCEAQNLLGDAWSVDRTKTSVICQERADKDAEWRTV